jgi:hypothetical protein
MVNSWQFNQAVTDLRPLIVGGRECHGPEGAIMVGLKFSVIEIVTPASRLSADAPRAITTQELE